MHGIECELICFRVSLSRVVNYTTQDRQAGRQADKFLYDTTANIECLELS
jgi:hypothetical protein